MTIEPVTEFGGGGALRVPRARVVPLSAPPASYAAAVERYLTGALWGYELRLPRR